MQVLRPKPIHRAGAVPRLTLATAVALAVPAALTLPATALASCFTPVSADLRALDRDTDGLPGRAAAEAARLLAAPESARDPLRAAELHAIAAQAVLEANRPEEVRAHVAAGLAAAGTMPGGDARNAVAIHLRTVQAIELILTGDATEAGQVLDASLRDAPANSVARSCVLTARSLRHLLTGALADAAADAIEAYEIARGWGTRDEQPGGDYARVNAAYHLAAIYTRVGLMPQAEQMVAEVIDYADRERLVHMATSAAFLQASILQEQRKFPDALATARKARALAEESGAAVSVAVATLGVCTNLVELKRYDEAEPTCRSGTAELTGAQRLDMLGEQRAQLARIAIARHRYADAVHLLGSVLKDGATPVPPVLRARYHRYRAEAHHAMGDLRSELQDIRSAEALEQQRYTRERTMAVAVIGAMNERTRWAADQRAMETRIDSQQRELAGQRLVRNLSIAFSVATLLLVTLLGWLLRKSRRQGHALRLQQASLSTIVRHAPDALVLLDGRRTVLYENRQLFGAGTSDGAGRTLDHGLPRPVAATLQIALDDVYEKRAPATALAVTGGDTDDPRYYEVHGAPVMENGALVGAVVRAADVTASHRLEREVVDASNRERLRLSSDLHEGVGQQLTGTMLLVQSLVADAERDRPLDREALASVAKYLSESIDAVRALARDLSPVAVDRGSLSDALRHLAQDTAALGDLPVDVSGVAPDVVVNDEAADHLYRIAREALANARKHSGGTRASIALERDADGVLLTIADDGHGLQDAAKSDGLGLRMIDYRARLLGGSASVESASPSGTRIRVRAAWTRCRRDGDASTASEPA